MKIGSNLFEIYEIQDADFFWNGVEVKKVGGSKKQLGDDDKEHDFDANIGKAKLNKPLSKHLTDGDTLTSVNLLKTLK